MLSYANSKGMNDISDTQSILAEWLKSKMNKHINKWMDEWINNDPCS